MTEQERRTEPPGLPLWRASERARLAAGIQKFEWIAQIGIGRKSYDRLTLQENPPITRTVRKIAERIGMPIDDAMRLAGLLPGDDIDTATDRRVDVVVQGPAGVIRIQGRAGTIHVEAENYQRPIAEQQLEALREAGHETGRTLGDVLVLTGLAKPEELKVTQDAVDSSTAIGGDTETASSRRGSST